MTKEKKEKALKAKTKDKVNKLSDEQLMECAREQVRELYQMYRLSSEMCHALLLNIFFGPMYDGLNTTIVSFGLFLEPIVEDRLKQASYEQLRLLFSELPKLTEYLDSVRVIYGIVTQDELGRSQAYDVINAIFREYRRLIRKVTLGWYGLNEDSTRFEIQLSW